MFFVYIDIMFKFQKRLKEYIKAKFMSIFNRFIKNDKKSLPPAPEPVKEPSPEPVKEPSPEPVKEPSPKPQKLKSIQKNKDKEYFYLSDKSIYYNFCSHEDLTEEFELYLCIYRINTILPIPYLEYYFEKTNLEYNFPSKKILPNFLENIIEEKNRLEPMEEAEEGQEKKGDDKQNIIKKICKDDDDDNEINTKFLEECYHFFKEKADYQKDFEEFKTIYRGFDYFLISNNEENKKKLFAVIDGTNIDIIKTEEITQKWAITDQIIKLKNIYDIPIDNNIIEKFENSQILNNIKKYNDKDKEELGSINIPYPQLLYLCKKEEDQYVNVYYEEEGETSQNTKTLIFDRVNHPILKDIYLFSKERFVSDKNIEQAKCFVLYTDENYMIKDEINETNIPEESVIGFKENDKDFWCTKTPRFFVESGEH